MKELVKIIDDETIVVEETGEIIRIPDYKSDYQEDIKCNFDEMVKDFNELGIKSDYKIIKHRNKSYETVNIKTDFEFNKEFRVEMRNLIKSGILSKNARCFLGTMTPFITFPSNSIMIDSRNPSVDDLKEMTGMGTNVIYNTLKELEEIKIIKRISTNTDLVIYINPFLYCSGYCVEVDTYEMFKDSSYNPENK